MKKIVGFLFLLILVIQYIGFPLYFHKEKINIQKQLKTYLKKGVPKNQLANFTFTKNEFASLNWTKPNKEFKIDENFYDVVYKYSNKKNQIHVQCVNDKQESKLFANLNQYIQKNLNHENKNSDLGFVFELLNSLYILNQETFQISFHKINSEKKYFITKASILNGYLNEINPPPIFC